MRGRGHHGSYHEQRFYFCIPNDLPWICIDKVYQQPMPKNRNRIPAGDRKITNDESITFSESAGATKIRKKKKNH